MLEAQPIAGLGEGSRYVAGAVVGHDAGHGYAETLAIGDGCLEEGYSAPRLLAGLDLAEGDARCIVDADMDELPARTATPGAAPGALACAVTGDAMANPLEAAELFDVNVD